MNWSIKVDAAKPGAAPPSQEPPPRASLGPDPSPMGEWDEYRVVLERTRRRLREARRA